MDFFDDMLPECILVIVPFSHRTSNFVNEWQVRNGNT